MKMRIALLIGLALLVVAGGYCKLIYEPEQARKPYVEAGLTVTQATSFVSKYPRQNGNLTWVLFAKEWCKDPALAETVFGWLGTLDDTLFTVLHQENASLIVDQLSRDARIPNKVQALRRIAANLPQSLKTLDQIYFLCNASQTVTNSLALSLALSDIGDYRIALKNLDGEPLRVHEAIAELYLYNVAFSDEDTAAIAGKYGIDLLEMKGILVRESAEQIVRLVYDKWKAPDNSDTWEGFIKPCLELSVRFLTDGLGTEYGDVNKIAYALIPPFIGDVDITTGKYVGPGSGSPNQGLVTATKNVTPQQELNGSTPAEWLHMRGLRDYQDSEIKERVRQQVWFDELDNWPHSSDAFQGYDTPHFISDPLRGLLKVLWNQTEGKLLFPRGYSAYLERILKMSEQVEGYYASLICWTQGLPATVVRATYPRGGNVHSEVAVWVGQDMGGLIREYGIRNSYGNMTISGLMCPWQYVVPFRMDYENKPIDPASALSYFDETGAERTVSLPKE